LETEGSDDHALRCRSDFLWDETMFWRLPLQHQQTIPMNRGMVTTSPVECAYLSEVRIYYIKREREQCL